MKRILTSIFCLINLGAFAQSTPTIPPAGVTITNVIPASADAAALGKFGSIPVSYFTGVPDISIPLYTIKSGDLTLPVSISYHSGGIKVEETASSVGLGWALNAGGCITRSVRGLPDEYLNGGLLATNNAANVYARIRYNKGPMDSLTAGQTLNQFVDGRIDAETDIFNFNFAGYTGEFVIKPATQQVMVIPQQNIRFSFVINNTSPAYIQSFTAITPNGVTYVFGSTSSSAPTDGIEFTTGGGKQTATGWWLKRMISPSGSEIDFTYQLQGGYSPTVAPTQSLYQLISGYGKDPTTGQLLYTNPVNYSSPSSAVQCIKLTNIAFENGNIQLYSNSARLDVPSMHSMDTIAITSAGFSKLYKFYYTNKSTMRLRLDSLVGQLDMTGNNNNKKEKYTFSYNQDPWTSPQSIIFAQDYWGYYNGSNNGIYLVPLMPDPSNPAQYKGSTNRDPNEGAMTGGMLTKITYPTGGNTVFAFEANREPTYNFGANGYTAVPYRFGFSNDTQSAYYNYDTNNGNPNHLIHIYSSANPDSQIPLSLIAYGLAYGSSPPAPKLGDEVQASIYRQDASGNYTIGVYEITNTDTTIYLPQGYYAIKFIDPKNQTVPAYSGDNGYIKYSVAYYWTNEVVSSGGPSLAGNVAGGVRIAQIADFDGINPNAYNVKRYTYTLNNGTSSGNMNFNPSYSYTWTVTAGAWNNSATSTYTVTTSTSNYPLATTQGSVVGYSQVQEYLDNNGHKGKNEYFYSEVGVYNNSSTGFPFSPSQTLDWHQGKMDSLITSAYAGNGLYARIQKKCNKYAQINNDTTINIKAGFNPKPLNYDATQDYYYGKAGAVIGPVQLITQPYYTVTDYTYLSSDTTWTYDSTNPSNFVKTWDNYQFDPTTYQLTRLQTLNSKNELITQSVTYPNSYGTFAAPGYGSLMGVENLTSYGISNYPIEEVTQKSNADGSNLRTIKAVLTTYKPKKPYRDSVYVMRSVAPVTNFVPSSTGVSTVTKDSHYQPVVSFDKYDAYGSILQERKVGDALHSYIWGYKSPNPPFNNTYPIAEAINTDSTSIAYTNFESYNTNGLGNWVYPTAGVITDITAPMGAGCYTVSSSNTLVKSGLTAANTYVVSFWAKSTGAAITVNGGTVTNVATGNAKSGWYYHEYSVTGATTVTIGGTGTIDEVRLYPSTAQMNTYTYIPLVGVASKCDTKNDITYYNFDNVGRLVQVQDQNRNILKDYQYNYTNQGPLWVDNGITQCIQDNYGNNTGEEQMQQQDTNPYSFTYGQLQWRSMGQQPGACPPPTVFVNIKVTSTNTHSGVTTNGYEIDEYSNSTCTIPMTLSTALNVNYLQTTTSTTPANQVAVTHTIVIPANTGKFNFSVNMNDCSPTGGTGCSSSVTLAPGSGYTTFAQANE